jgi:succinate dehydrogenase / fumarate reductase cytochrome b subunit
MSRSLFRLASISKKITMGLAGVFLLLFLLVHLGINLTLMRCDEGEWFNAASHFMGSNYVVKVFEIVLLLAFFVHILIGVLLKFQNWRARPVRYSKVNSSETAFMSKYMFHTGVIVFVFLILHFINFYFIKLGFVEPPIGIDKHDFYQMAKLLFTDTGYSLIYIVALIVLGVHLNHAFQSAFQTFGMHHNKYYGAIKRAALIYAIIISLGFISIPVYFLFFFTA